MNATAAAERTPGTLRREMFIEAEPATVFAFFVDPEKMARWMGTSHTLDARPGGAFVVDVVNGFVARGEFREVTPHTRLVYTWGWDREESGVPPGSSTIEVDLEPRDGGTRLVFTHSGLPEPKVASHEEGWDHYLGRLVTAATGGDPGPDTWMK